MKKSFQIFYLIYILCFVKNGVLSKRLMIILKAISNKEKPSHFVRVNVTHLWENSQLHKYQTIYKNKL